MNRAYGIGLRLRDAPFDSRGWKFGSGRIFVLHFLCIPLYWVGWGFFFTHQWVNFFLLKNSPPPRISWCTPNGEVYNKSTRKWLVITVLHH